MGNNTRFGWHSGTMRCKDAKILGDIYIQDDIIFSDVSAGVLGVTGGIDMTETTTAYGIDMNGATMSTADWRLNDAGTIAASSGTLTITDTNIVLSGAVTMDAPIIIYTAQTTGDIVNIGWESATTFTSAMQGIVLDMDTRVTSDNAAIIAFNIDIAGTSNASTKVFDIDSKQTAGTLIDIDLASTLTETTIGIALDMATSVTAGSKSVYCYVATVPTTSGTSAGFYVAGTATYGLDITDSSCATGIYIGDTTTAAITFGEKKKGPKKGWF